VVELAHPPEHGRVDIFGHVRLPRDPGEQVAVRKLDQALEVGKLRIAQLRQRRSGP
jgi:hypothetical protein